jgi:hypothetical protein
MIALLTLAAVGSAQQVSPIEAKLTIPDAKVLPGVPFDMWVDIHNPSDTLVTVGLCPRLVVRTDSGKSFEIASNASDYPILLRSPRTEGEGAVFYVTLAPGERRTLTLPAAEAMAGSIFFRDSRIMPPGRYGISLRLEAFPLGLTEPPPLTFLGSVVTNDAFVERIEPNGVDAKVWSRMQEVSNGKWSLQPLTISSDNAGVSAQVAGKMSAVWSEIVHKYPDSNYVPYALLLSTGVDEAYAKSVFAAIAKFPSSPIVESLDAKAKDFALRYGGVAVFERESAKVHDSKRPTTRIIAFGREDVPRAECGPGVACER